MKNAFTYIGIVAVVAFSSFAALAQEKTKVEIFGGYSYLRQDLGDLEEAGFDTGVNTNGFNASVTGNVSKWIGLKFDYSTHSKALTESDLLVPTPLNEGLPSTFELKLRNSQYLGGVQIKNNLKDGPTFKPFAHVLAGVSNLKLTCTDCFLKKEGTVSSISTSENNFAMVFGGGLDIKVHENVDIRVFQVDYNPIWFRGSEDLELESATLNNFRMSFGAVFHW